MPKPIRLFPIHKHIQRTAVATAYLVIAGLLLACSGGGPEIPLPDPAPPPSTPATGLSDEGNLETAPATDAPLFSTDGPADSGTEPLVWIVPTEAVQGSAFLVAVDAPGAGFASVAFDGQIFSLLNESGRFFTILGIDALTPVGPIPIVIAVADAVGRPILQQEALVNVTAANWQTEIIELDESNQALLDPAVQAADQAVRLPSVRQETPERHWDGVFDPPSNGVITSGYGLLRSYNYLPAIEYHEGLDFAGANGDPVLAPNAGVVSWVGQTRRRGNGMILDHGGGLFSGYYHLSEILVSLGSVINTGDFIGRIGATGLATGPHLHWEMIIHGVPVNPVQWIRATKFPDPLIELDPALALTSRNQRAE